MMRAEVIGALASLADQDYQRRVWLNHALRPGEPVNSLSDVVHALYDDMVVLPDPRSSLGTVLIEGDEIDRLVDLNAILDPLLDKYAIADIHRMMLDETWDLITQRAARTLFAMIRAGF
jgi:hypothetical protein